MSQRAVRSGITSSPLLIRAPFPANGVMVVCGFSAENDQAPFVYRSCACREKIVPSDGPVKSTVSGKAATSWKLDQVWPASQLFQLTYAWRRVTA
ncbi:hypothetical protein D3C81_1210400 [compost metagenome]